MQDYQQFKGGVPLDKKNGNTLWDEAISNKMMALDKLGVFQLYPPKNQF